MPSVTQRVADVITRHSVDLLRVSDSIVSDVLSDLRQLEADLVQDLTDVLGATEFTKARLRELLTQTRETIATAYAGIEESTPPMLKSVAEAVARRMIEGVNKTVRVELMSVGLSPEQAEWIAGKTVVNGRFPAEWWGKQSQVLRDRFAATMRQGQYRGETIQQLVQRVRGTKATQFRDGVMRASRTQAEALVRTSVIAVANEAKLRSYINNRDVIKGIQWVATLDDRTCWTPETAINMADGSTKPIGEIRVGDWVQGGITGNACRVTDVQKTFNSHLLAVYLNGRYAGRTTREHRILGQAGWTRAEDFSVSAPLRESEVLCRSSAQPAEATSRARATCKQGSEGSNLRSDSGARSPDDHNPVGARDISTGVCCGSRSDSNTQHTSTERIQHDSGRRGSREPAVVDPPSGGREETRTHRGGAGIATQTRSVSKANRKESVARKQAILPNRTRSRSNEQAVAIRVAEQRYESESARTDREQARAHEGRGDEELVGTEQASTNEPRTRRSAKETKPKSGLGRIEARKACCDDAREMARPRLSSEDGSTISEGEVEARDASEADEIISLTVECDHSYVAGGIIVHNTDICRELNGKVWLLPESGDKDADYIPDGHNTPFPGATAHWQCRSTQVAITYSFKELAEREANDE